MWTWLRESCAMLLAVAASLPLVAGSRFAMLPPLDKSNLPDAGGEWISLEEGLEFQGDPRVLSEYEAESSSSSSSSSYDRIFVDGGDTYYDEYSQAWRVLGWYIDCDDCPNEIAQDQDDYDESSSSNAYRNMFCRGADSQNPYLQMEFNYINDDNVKEENNKEGNNNKNRRRQRRLEEDNDDAAATSYSSSSSTQSQCSRVLLWAAYVDLNYDGNQNTEYQFFNRRTNLWDTSLCQGSSTRCAKMDCHLPNTDFKLLGIFKDRRSDVWMSQLFNRQGDCVWSDEEYSFMNYAGRNNGLSLPTGCTRSQAYVSELSGSTNGLPLYFDIKPAMYGRVTVGLYVDSECIQVYRGEVTAEQMMVSESKYTIPLDSSGNRTSSLDVDLEIWNRAFDAFKFCQPCKAYDITRAVVSKGFQRNYNNNRFGSTGDSSACSSNASPNFNQCKLFVRAGYSRTASYSEVEQAGQQGTIAGIQVNGVAYGRTNVQMNLAPLEMTLSWVILAASALLFISGVVSLLRARVAAKRALSATLREPLVPSEGVVA